MPGITASLGGVARRLFMRPDWRLRRSAALPACSESPCVAGPGYPKAAARTRAAQSEGAVLMRRYCATMLRSYRSIIALSFRPGDLTLFRAGYLCCGTYNVSWYPPAVCAAIKNARTAVSVIQ